MKSKKTVGTFPKYKNRDRRGRDRMVVGLTRGSHEPVSLT